MQVTLYTAIIDRLLLKDLVFMSLFDDTDRKQTADSLRDGKIKDYLLGMIFLSKQLQNVTCSRKSTNGLNVPFSITKLNVKGKKPKGKMISFYLVRCF